MIIRNQNPKGGTELQFEYLEKYVDKNLLDQVQICTSVPEKIPLHPTKPNILWQKNSYDQPNLAPWFKKENKIMDDLDFLVFGHWAALQGKTDISNILALDTGCCWGKELTFLRLEDQKKFVIKSKQK